MPGGFGDAAGGAAAGYQIGGPIGGFLGALGGWLLGGDGGAGDTQEEIGRLLLQAYRQQQQYAEPLMAQTYPAVQRRMTQTLPLRRIAEPQQFNPFQRMVATAQKPTSNFLSVDQLLKSNNKQNMG